MELSPSWPAASSSAPQEFAYILWNPYLHYNVHKSPLCNISKQNYFLRWEFVSPTPNTQVGGLPLMGSPRLLIQFVGSCSPYLTVVSRIRNLRTRRTKVAMDRLNAAALHIWLSSRACATWGRAVPWWQWTDLTQLLSISDCRLAHPQPEDAPYHGGNGPT
jgi:hypothetical protein